MIWALLYLLLLAALVVRVRATDASPPAPPRPARGEPLWMTRLHHGLFALLLLGPPLEALLTTGATQARLLGALLFAGGVVLYRVAGIELGDALSPFVGPRAGARLVTGGLYRYVRHPMYVSEAMIAVGAPLTLGSRLAIWLAVPALIVLVVRVVREEETLARTFPEYPRYASRTKRIVPFLY